MKMYLKRMRDILNLATQFKATVPSKSCSLGPVLIKILGKKINNYEMLSDGAIHIVVNSG